jgi:hypothetical protein
MLETMWRLVEYHQTQTDLGLTADGILAIVFIAVATLGSMFWPLFRRRKT